MIRNTVSDSGGSRVAKYEILRPIGKGGMGEVYAARDTALDREVALKFIASAFAADEHWKRRFLREARTASRLTHPNAAVIYDAGEFEGRLFLAMEFVRGVTLADVLKTGPLPLERAQDYALQLADVLGAAHQLGIVHRDLKPANIMVADGRVKLMDFGLATVESTEPPDPASPTESVLTRPGAIVGTPAYLSPERIHGEPADARADLFAYGLVVYEMAVGDNPFTGANAVTTAANILHQPLPPLPARLPPALANVIRRCLEKDPAQRCQSAAEIVEALKPQRVFDVRPPWASPRLTRRLALAAGAVAVGGAGWWGWRSWRGSFKVRSLAVLPFTAPETMAEGLTESVINLIAQAPEVRVLTRGAVYNPRIAKLDPMAAGKTLDVDAILTGKVVDTGHSFQVTADLVEVRTARQLWGKRFEVPRELVASIQAEIAGPLLERLGVPHAAASAKKSGDVPPEAYQAFLNGRYYLNKRTRDGIEKSVGYFLEALDKKPDYALAWAGVAMSFAQQAGLFPPKDVNAKALSAAEKAVQYDPNLAESQATLAWIRLIYNWDWRGSEAGFQSAIRLSQSYARAHGDYATLLVCRKRFDQAIAEVRTAATLDPLSQGIAVTLANVFYQARRTTEAIDSLSRVLSVEKRSVSAMFFRGTALIQAGRYEDAIRDFEAGLAIAADMGAVGDLGLAYAKAGMKDKARQQIERIEQVARQRYVAPYFLAFPHIGLGDLDKAIDLLERSVDDRAFPVIYMGVEPKLDPLRADPRFQRLCQLVGV